jgi:hypothetical protein
MEEQSLSESERIALAALLSKAGRAAALSPEALADWLAGRADVATAAKLDAALAADPNLRAALLAVQQGESQAATEAELARALSAFPATPRLTPMPRVHWLRPIAAAAMLAGAIGFGWMLGLSFGDHALHSAAASAADLFGNDAAL